MNTTKISIAALAILAFIATAHAADDPNHFDPENAAHWYRKAFELYEEPNDIDLFDFARGKTELTPEIKQFLEKQESVINLFIKATRIEKCDWKFDPFAFPNGTYSMNPYLSDMKNIAYLLLANSRYKEITNQHQTIQSYFEPVLRVASHIDSEILINHLAAIAIRAISYTEILEYLNRHSDCQLVELYRAKALMTKDCNRPSITYKETLNHDIEFVTRILTDYTIYIYNDKRLSETWGIPVRELSDDFYRRNLVFLKNYMYKIQSSLDLPYSQAIQKINEQGQSLNANFKEHFTDYKEVIETSVSEKPIFEEIDIKDIETCDFLYTVITKPYFDQFLNIETRILTRLNALEAGIDLLIRYQSSQNLPERLPLNSPKDLFTEKPFELIKTGKGFKLISKGAEYTGDRKELYEYEFVLPED